MNVLKAEHLTKSFRSGKRVVHAVQDVSLACEAGEIVAFLGTNGAGKTTTLKMLTGLIHPDAGSVQLAQLDPRRDLRAFRHVGAVMEGNRNLYSKLTVLENCDYFGSLRGLRAREIRERALTLLGEFGLLEKKDTLVQFLSRGMQQRLALLISILHRPSVLLLDEPTLGLDARAVQDMKMLVRQLASQGCAILLTTHQLDIAQELSQRVVIMAQGRIVKEQTTEQLLHDTAEPAFIVNFSGHPSAEQVNQLTALGCTLLPNQLSYSGSVETVYRVLDLLRPLPLDSVQNVSANLEHIFLCMHGQPSEQSYA